MPVLPARLSLTLCVLALACETTAPATTTAGASGETSTSTTTETAGSTGTETDATSETGTASESETGAGSSCDDEAHQACLHAASTASQACEEACGPTPDYTCEGEVCRWACMREEAASTLACFAEHCPEPSNPDMAIWLEDLICMEPCHAELSTCQAEQSCIESSCAVEALACINGCNNCLHVPSLSLAYAGSCELALGATVPPSRVPYASFSIPSSIFDWDLRSGRHYDLTSCELESGMGGVWDDANQNISLCPEPCADFETHGVLLVHLPPPPCN